LRVTAMLAFINRVEVAPRLARDRLDFHLVGRCWFLARLILKRCKHDQSTTSPAH
jgi:hypothetical protein